MNELRENGWSKCELDGGSTVAWCNCVYYEFLFKTLALSLLPDIILIHR